MGSDKRRFQALIHDLDNSFSKGTDSCPKTASYTYALLTNWKVDRSTGCMLQEVLISFHQRDKKRNDSGIKKGGGDPMRPKRCHKYLTCHRYIQKGHIAPNFPSKHESDIHVHAQDGDESLTVNTDATKASSSTEHMANDISHIASKRANQLLVKSIQETAKTNDGAAYHMLDFLGFNNCQNAMAYSRKAFNLTNVSIPNMLVLLESQSTVHLMCNPRLVSNVR